MQGNESAAFDWARIPVILMAPVQVGAPRTAGRLVEGRALEVVGLVGNIASVCVFRQMLGYSVNILFLALAVADALILLFGGLLYLPVGFYSELQAFTPYQNYIAVPPSCPPCRW